MADNDEIQGLTVKVGVTDDLFTQGVTRINKSMSLLRSEFKASAAGLQAFGSDTEKLANKQDFLNRSIELQNGKIKALKEAYDKSKSATGEFSDATQTAGTKLNNAIAYMAKMQGELKDVDEALEKSKKEVNDNSSMWDKFREKIASATSGIGESIKRGIGLSIGHDIWDKFKEGSVSVLTFGSDAQKAMNQLQASTGMSTESLNGMKQTMTDIYNDNFGESFADIGDALGVIQQNWRGNSNEIKGLTENALLLRDTFGYEVNESFRSANALVQNFGISAQDAYNLIAQGAQNGLDKNGDLLDTMNEYPVEFKSLGLTAQDMFNMLQNGAKAGGFSIDKMGDAVKEFSIRAKDGSSTTQDALSKLGLDVQQTEAKFARGGDTAKQAFQQVNDKLLGLKDPLLQNQLGVELWGTQWEDLQKSGIAAITNLNGSISTSKNALQDMNKIKYNDLGSAFEGIKRNLQTGILLPISNEILPKLNDFSNWFTQHMPEIQQNISNSMKQVLPVINSGAKVLGDGFNLILTHMPQIQAVVGATFQVIGPILSTGLKLLGDGFALASKHTDAFKVALVGMGIAFAGFKIGQGVVASINGIKSAVDNAKTAIDNVKIAAGFMGDKFNTIKGVVQNGASAFADFAKSAANVTIELAKTTAALIRQGIEWLATKIQMIATTIATGAATLAQNALNIAMSLNPIGIVVIALAGLAAGLVIAYNKSETFRNIVNGAFNGVKNTAEWVVNGVVGAWNGLWDNIHSIGARIKSFMSSIWDFRMPHIPLPHFNIQGSFSLVPPSIPSIGVNWYAKGGIFNSPSVIGVGESGREAVMPLENNIGWIDELAGKLNSKIGGNSKQSLTFKVVLQNGKAIAEYIIDDINDLQSKQADVDGRNRGYDTLKPNI